VSGIGKVEAATPDKPPPPKPRAGYQVPEVRVRRRL
jgi:hypothetical protein